MDTQFNSLMSLGTHNYFARCPQRPRALLALRPSQLALAVTTGPITWAGRAPRAPGTKGAGRGRPLEAASWATLWRRAQPRSAVCPAAGTRPTLRHLGLTDSPHQPRRGQRQRL